MKAKRGTAPEADSKAGPAAFMIITKALYLTGFIGQLGPSSVRSTEAPYYALTVPLEHALDELSFQFSRKGWGHIEREEFSDALRKDGILDFNARSERAVDLNRRQTRKRMRKARS